MGIEDPFLVHQKIENAALPFAARNLKADFVSPFEDSKFILKFEEFEG